LKAILILVKKHFDEIWYLSNNMLFIQQYVIISCFKPVWFL